MESRAHTSILLRLKRINIFLKLFLNKLWFFFFSLWFQDKILTRKVLFSVISCSRKWSTCSPDCGAIPLQIPVLNAPPLRCPSWDEFPLDVGDLNGVSRDEERSLCSHVHRTSALPGIFAVVGTWVTLLPVCGWKGNGASFEGKTNNNIPG